MTHIAPDTYDSGIRWNGTRILVRYVGPDYAAYLEGVEPPTGHVLDGPEKPYHQGWGIRPLLAVEDVLQQLVDDAQ